MAKKFNNIYGENKENVDLHDIYELIELGLDKEEISKEVGISEKYIKKMIRDYYDDI